MAIQGLRNTGVTGGTGANNSFVAGQRPLNWRDAVLLLDPNGMAPLYALSSLMKSASVDDPEFNWWEKRLESKRVALGAAITTAGQTSLTLTAGGSRDSRRDAAPHGRWRRGGAGRHGRRPAARGYA